MTVLPGNLAYSSAPGCHIASDSTSSWVLSRRRFSRRSLGLRKADAVPDISLEPQRKTLMFLNPSEVAKAYFVSVLHRCTGRQGPLAPGESRDAQGRRTPVTTLIVTVQPQQTVEVCTVEVRRAVEVQLFSDIVELPAPPLSAAESTECAKPHPMLFDASPSLKRNHNPNPSSLTSKPGPGSNPDQAVRRVRSSRGGLPSRRNRHTSTVKSVAPAAAALATDGPRRPHPPSVAAPWAPEQSHGRVSARQLRPGASPKRRVMQTGPLDQADRWQGLVLLCLSICHSTALSRGRPRYDKADEVEAARRSFREGLLLQPDYAQLYHAWARLEGRLGNLDGLAEINARARDNFPVKPSTASPYAGRAEPRAAPARTDDDGDDGDDDDDYEDMPAMGDLS